MSQLHARPPPAVRHGGHQRPTPRLAWGLEAVCTLRKPSNAAWLAAAWSAQRKHHPRSAVVRSASSLVAELQTGLEDSHDDSWNAVHGPAFKATLKMLEWPRLLQHVAQFASTRLGRAAVMQMTVPVSRDESLRLLSETK